ncbi:MAG TPA: hypothetical protein PLV72_01215 [Candidatus Magasanikbacteria bacterium]|nr:hypothetical protein [Candidatus Magasanikbacteria bacterium]
MQNRIFIIIALLISASLGVWALVNGVSWYRFFSAERSRNQAIDNVINSHRSEKEGLNDGADPFGEDGVVRVLFIGLDKRAGQTEGHCDAIQLITIDKTKPEVLITAVPRGTYSPLPFGKGVTSSDYYVSNACGLGGLEYGIDQIEKILGQRADYLVTVGFSEVLGVLRNLELPTTETLQWLRQRHSYAIGEPQRAHDHSTFLKYLLTNFIPRQNTQIDKALQYIVFKTVNTDLSFSQAQTIIGVLSTMDLANQPERVHLAMRPAYSVQDIEYVPENLGQYLDSTLSPIKDRLAKDDYSGDTAEEVQNKLLNLIDGRKNDPEFIAWVFENDLWLQIEDREKRLSTQFEFLEKYISLESKKAESKSIVAEYILEMENRGESMWVEKGRELLAREI